MTDFWVYECQIYTIFAKTARLTNSIRHPLQQSLEPVDSPFLRSFGRMALDVGIYLFFLIHMGVFVNLPLKITGGTLPGIGFVWALGAVIGLGLALAKPFRTAGIGIAIFPFVVICLWACLSYRWSVDPNQTLLAAIFMTCSLIGACGIAALLTWEEILARLTIAIGGLVVLSVGLAIGLPSVGQMAEGELAGAWSGVWMEKQAMGLYAALLILASSANVLANRKNWPCLFLIPISFVAIIGTTGATAVFMCIVGIAVLTAGWLIQRDVRIAIATVWSALVIGGLATYAATLGKEEIFRLFGKSPNLTGRTDIWREVEYLISKEPVTGYGFHTIWTSQKSLDGPFQWIAAGTDFAPQNAHSSWLDAKLQLGPTGLILLVACIGLAWLVTLVRLRKGGAGAIFALSALAILTFSSFTESIFLTRMDMPWMLVILITAKMMQEIVFPLAGPMAPRLPLTSPPHNGVFTYTMPPR